jgi:hypothetical protein
MNFNYMKKKDKAPLFTAFIITGLNAGCAARCLDNTHAVFGFGLTTPAGFSGFNAQVVSFRLLDSSRVWVIAAGILAIATNYSAIGRFHTIGISGCG